MYHLAVTACQVRLVPRLIMTADNQMKGYGYLRQHILADRPGARKEVRATMNAPTTIKRQHPLMPEALRQRLPAIGATEHDSDPMVWVRYFTPKNPRWNWYGIEYDGKDLVFGLIFGHFEEVGGFSLNELEHWDEPFRFRVERDLNFQPQPVSQVRQWHHEREGGKR